MKFAENDRTRIYVVNKDYQIVYFNETLGKVFPFLKTGDLCFEKLCGEKEPCQECPFCMENASSQIYYDTGLYRQSAFFKKAEELLRIEHESTYCMMAIDIEHFKLFNEWYGRQAGDQFLLNTGIQLERMQEKCKCVAGYIGGDDFAIVLPDTPFLLEELQKSLLDYARQYGGNAGFLPAFGIYQAEDVKTSVRTMYDRAVIAMEKVKGNYAHRVSRYDRKMKQQRESRQQSRQTF